MTPGERTEPGDRQQKQPRTGAPVTLEDQMLTALGRFQGAADAAAGAWSAGLTTQQGLDIMWMTGSIVTEFRIFTTMLSRYQATGPDGQPDPTLNTPNEQIRDASQCLDPARVLTRIGRPALLAGVQANKTRGVPAGGDPARDGPAVAAAHAMYTALRVSDGRWHEPSGSPGLRDRIVTETMFATASMHIAVSSLADGAPKPFGTTLTLIARNLDISCGHLRESLICSATGNYQPGTEDLARQIRESYPLFSETSGAALPAGTGAPGLAKTCFPSTAVPSADPALPADIGDASVRPPAKRYRPTTRNP
jgi:hypothetical protein